MLKNSKNKDSRNKRLRGVIDPNFLKFLASMKRSGDSLNERLNNLEKDQEYILNKIS